MDVYEQFKSELFRNYGIDTSVDIIKKIFDGFDEDENAKDFIKSEGNDAFEGVVCCTDKRIIAVNKRTKISIPLKSITNVSSNTGGLVVVSSELTIVYNGQKLVISDSSRHNVQRFQNSVNDRLNLDGTSSEVVVETKQKNMVWELIKVAIGLFLTYKILVGLGLF